MITDATFSQCRKYRYALQRLWGSDGPLCMFICLNPSTADEAQDDPTVRRLIGFARSWGYRGLWLGNLFAFRATDPHVMRKAADPIGPRNDEYLQVMAGDSDIIVAAWGAQGCHLRRSREVHLLIPTMKCFGLTMNGEPKHPLYLSKNTEIIDL